ncbi:MAG: hypothetical protein L0219_17860 [Phycisphaerales bacterium]|nr:hypothetical protein [Phycisphaerales bacterium]
MVEAIKRNAVILLGLILAGAACVMASGYLASPRGALGPTVMGAQSPVSAGLAILLCFTGATIVACLVARMINPLVGLFVLGAGLFALAGRAETVAELAFSGSPPGGRTRLALLAIETMMWAGLVLAASFTAFKVGTIDNGNQEAGDESIDRIWGAESLKMAAGAAVVLVAVWIIAKSPTKGQMIGATFFGGLAAGMLGRALGQRTEPVLLFAAPIFFGAIGHVIGMLSLKMPLDQAFVLRELSVFSLPMPIDYAAGSLMGVAVGWGWAESFHHKPPDERLRVPMP